MALKPQDVVVLLKASISVGGAGKYADLAHELGMSASEVHSAIKRATISQLVVPKPEHGRWSVQRRNFMEFLLHGLRYAFPGQRGPETRGIPTGIGSPILAPHFAASSEQPPVWPDPEGTVRGPSLKPLYPSVPHAAMRDSKLYAALALVDAIRGGRARERGVAAEILQQLLSKDEP